MATNTKCTDIGGLWDAGKPFDNVANGTLSILGILLGVISIALATPATLLLAGIALLSAAIAFLIVVYRGREYFFNHRLMCVREHQCALGKVGSLEDDGDGDSSINLILAPADNEDTSLEMYKQSLQGRLVFGLDQNTGTELQQVKDLRDQKGWLLNPTANRPDFPGATNWGNKLPFFHCEIEGTKFDDWTTAIIAYLSALIAFAIGIILFAGILAALGPIGWIIGGALFILLLLIAFFTNAITGDKGAEAVTPSEYPNAIPDASGPILTGNNREVQVNDFIALYGRYIIDTAHHNPQNPNEDEKRDLGVWFELHPIRAITKVEESTYKNFPNGIDEAIDTQNVNLEKYCEALQIFSKGRGELTGKALEHKSVG